MQLSKRRSAIALALLALALSTLACNAAGLSRNGAAAPHAPAVEVSENALESFNEKWREINLATPGGPFTVTFTEAELTSAVHAGIAQAEADTGQPLPIQNVQVALRDGSVQVFGQVKVDPLTMNGQITAVPYIDTAGDVRLDVTSAEFGMFEVDQSLLNSAVASVENSINQPIRSSPGNINLTNVTVTDGSLTVSGNITP